MIATGLSKSDEYNMYTQLIIPDQMEVFISFAKIVLCVILIPSSNLQSEFELQENLNNKATIRMKENWAQ